MKIDDTIIYDSLKKFFGFNEFKGLQKQVITNICENNNTFVVMPTGGGKSLCYQLPALIKEGTAIIVSPLIALMKNQVDQIRGYSDIDGIAHVFNSTLTKNEKQKVKDDVSRGVTKLLYMAPESISKTSNIDFLKSSKVSLLAIDEAHCISEWGHDFRPEYRNLRIFADKFQKNVPIIALTATATPKVQSDILKNLDINDAKIFKASFNRPNLFYEVRYKKDSVDKDLIKFIKTNNSKSGIIYCLSRKKVEEIAKLLQLNDIKALPYHAGLETKTRSDNQDKFLKEDVDVIVATIAFGMGIDKPNIRFVIHYDVPKSIEGYYQETGRAGRDGGEGHCLAFYSYKDIEKLEKFITSKSNSEKQLSSLLLEEMVSYCETSISRRKYLLNYFGEEFDNNTGEGGMFDDNMVNPKKKINAKNEILILLNLINDTKQIYKAKELADILVGNQTSLIKSHKLNEKDFFAIGEKFDRSFWIGLIRQLAVERFVEKNIESYGVILIKEKGKEFLSAPKDFNISEDHKYANDDKIISKKDLGLSADPELMSILKKLRKEVADKLNLPPYIIFQDPSLEDMTLKYPITIDEMANIHGVGEGKAKKYGKEFIDLISKYINENDITRPNEFMVKTSGSNSGLKLFIIQSVDRKISFDDIITSKGIKMDELINEMESIVYSGTKLDLSYCIDDILDEDQQSELKEYFMESDNDSIEEAMQEFEGDYEDFELRIYRIVFLSEFAN
ncbi:MAG: DNA helicase RecQ [Gammaproteobacteria bacterium]|nr:DNA helicase RecQ [Gammaproteobacteria bacterium]